MSTLDRIDPEILAGVQVYFDVAGPDGIMGIKDIQERRARFEQLMELAASATPANERVVHEDHLVPGPPGSPKVRVRVYRPAHTTGPLPGILVIHGGGMIIGSIETEHLAATALVDASQTVAVSVGYRLAPEHRHPAPVEDCFAALRWMADNAGPLDIDVSRLAVYGGSAGGGLCASTALMARDRGGPRLAFQMLIYPMLDDRNTSPSSHEIVDLKIWDRSHNLEAWRCLLGEAAGGKGVSPYAAAARAPDLSGLPPTYIDVGELDLFRDESIEYASRLMQQEFRPSCTCIPAASTAATPSRQTPRPADES
jgi:acetyl esterase/lipase